MSAIDRAHDARRAHRRGAGSRHDRVGLGEMALRQHRQARRRLGRSPDAASTAAGSVAGDAGRRAALRAADKAGRSPHPRRGRAGYWSAAARGRDDGPARGRPRAPCRRPAPTAGRPRWRPGRNKDRAWRMSGARMSARRPSPCRRSRRGNRSRAQIELAHGLRQALQMRRRRAGIERVDIAAPVLQRRLPRVARASDRRRCRRPRGKRHRSRTSPRAARAAGCACRYRRSCRAARLRGLGSARSLTPPAVRARRRKAAADTAEAAA